MGARVSAWATRRRLSRTGPTEPETGERTYGIWGPIALFVLLTLAGLGLLLTVGTTPSSRSVQVQTPQTLPERPSTTVTGGSPTTGAPPTADPEVPTTAPVTVTTVPSATSPVPSTPAVTMPGGTPAPPGVRDVVITGRSVTYTFVPPESFAALDPAVLDALVAPVAASAGSGSTVRVEVGCARSPEEHLAQVSLLETDRVITVLAVALVPPGGGPCTPSSPIRRLDLDFTSPIAGRAIEVVPFGTPAPGAATG